LNIRFGRFFRGFFGRFFFVWGGEGGGVVPSYNFLGTHMDSADIFAWFGFILALNHDFIAQGIRVFSTDEARRHFLSALEVQNREENTRYTMTRCHFLIYLLHRIIYYILYGFKQFIFFKN
jgi:hypothetical protein